LPNFLRQNIQQQASQPTMDASSMSPSEDGLIKALPIVIWKNIDQPKEVPISL
jgi:hypothetical protein